MTEHGPMTPERFADLADAYGGDLGRWPEAEHAPAASLLARDADARELLLEAAALDGMLDLAEASSSAVLRERIIALAPRPRRPVWLRGRTWVSGAGLAAACLLGVIVGVNASADLLGEPTVDSVVEAATAFDGTGYFDALESAG